MDSLTTIVNTRESLENTIYVKLPNSYTMASTDQAHAPLQNVSIQAKHAENLPNLHSILISIGKFCDN